MFDFSSQYRLVSKHDFQSVFAKANKAAHKSLLALYIPNQKPHARLGMVIAKHRIKLAVKRNRLRRLIRESFRHHKERLKGFDIIVLLRSNDVSLDNTELRHDIDMLWERLK